MPPKLIDVHTHVQFSAYPDPEEIVQRALKNGIWIVNVGTQKDTSKEAVLLADKYGEGVYAAIGLHPVHTNKSFHDEQELGGGEAAKAFTSKGEEFDYDYYLSVGKKPKVVAIGECGLDYYRGQSGDFRARQIKAFDSQIFLSNEVKKPLMIHCRNGEAGNAFKDLIKILKYHELGNEFPGIVHFFSGSKEDAKDLMDMGFCFSFGGVTTFARDYDEVIQYIGADRVVLETDAPYVAPHPFRGKKNEPSYLPLIADKIGSLLGLDSNTVAEKTTSTARKILKI